MKINHGLLIRGWHYTVIQPVQPHPFSWCPISPRIAPYRWLRCIHLKKKICHSCFVGTVHHIVSSFQVGSLSVLVKSPTGWRKPSRSWMTSTCLGCVNIPFLGGMGWHGSKMWHLTNGMLGSQMAAPSVVSTSHLSTPASPHKIPCLSRWDPNFCMINMISASNSAAWIPNVWLQSSVSCLKLI